MEAIRARNILPMRDPLCRPIVVLIAILCCASQGCGPRGRNVKLAPVSGKVMYRSAPLKNGQIVLVHDSGQMGASEIGPDGSYKLEAAVGLNAVMIRCRDEPNLSTMGADADRGFKLAKSLIPTKYENFHSSGFKIDVVDGSNEKDWALTD